MSEPTDASPRVLVLGGNGMFGHRLWLECRRRFDTYLTVRDGRRLRAELPEAGLEPARTLDGVTVENFSSVAGAIEAVRPSVVVNCIGLVKQRALADDPAACIDVNALFPHRLARVCRQLGTRLIHVSTDCVFSGAAGRYTEADVADAQDLYGRTKVLGEVTGERCLTIRTSLIGRELSTSYGLVEWFLEEVRQRRGVHGRTRAIFNGLTTHEAADVVIDVIARHTEVEGLMHVAAEPISKFDLLALLRESMALTVDLIPDVGFLIDRSLDGSRFREATGWVAPSWPDMLRRVAQDASFYDQRRSAHARG